MINITNRNKAPTLDELVEQERVWRGHLQSTLADLEDTLAEELPEIDGSGDACFRADEIALHGIGIHTDATTWGKAAEALAEALAKQKKKKTA